MEEAKEDSEDGKEDESDGQLGVSGCRIDEMKKSQ